MAARKRITQHCEKCDQEIGTYAFKRHYKACNGIILNNTKILLVHIQTKNSKICPICFKLYKPLGIVSHIRFAHLKEPNPHLGKPGGNQYTKYPAWEISDETREKLRLGTKKQIWTPLRKHNLSVAMKLAVKKYPESYNSSNRGRTKQIIFDGIKFQGKWELDFYKWAKSVNLYIRRVTNGFPYEWNGNRTYFPDFYVPSLDLYVEIKGYETERDLAKWKYFPKKLKILRANDLKNIRNGTFLGL